MSTAKTGRFKCLSARLILVIHHEATKLISMIKRLCYDVPTLQETHSSTTISRDKERTWILFLCLLILFWKRTLFWKELMLFWKRTYIVLQSTIACGKSLSKPSTATESMNASTAASFLLKIMNASICCIIKVILTATTVL
jgi:hypothetical protein